MKHIDDFFQTQSILMWHPGAMGAFLMNFLDAGLPNYKTKLELRKLGMLENKEWQYGDYFMSYYDYNFPIEYPKTAEEVSRIKKIISMVYGEENVEKYTAYLIAILCHQMVYGSNRSSSLRVLGELLPLLKHIKTVDDVNLFLNRTIDNKYHYYVKLHPSHTIDISIPWKEKILCYFPPEKNWMRFILHFYKLSFYNTLKANKPYFDNNLPFVEIVNGILKGDSVRLGNWIPEDDVYQIIPKEEWIHVNIYDLLFKDGYNHLITNMTPEQQTVLQQAKDSTLEILKVFNLTHDLELYGDIYINTFPKFETFRELVRKHYK